jgi:hypothetical protein
VPAEQAASGEWGEDDSDWSYTVLVRIGAASSKPQDAVSVTFRHSCLRRGMMRDYVAFYGSGATIHVEQPMLKAISTFGARARTRSISWRSAKTSCRACLQTRRFRIGLPAGRCRSAPGTRWRASMAD